jgi:hypothetical protein
MIHKKAKIADLRGIVDLGPVNRADYEYAETGGEPNEKDGTNDRPNWGGSLFEKAAWSGVRDGAPVAMLRYSGVLRCLIRWKLAHE